MWQVWFRFPNDPNNREWYFSCEATTRESLQAYIDFCWNSSKIEYEIRPPISGG